MEKIFSLLIAITLVAPSMISARALTEDAALNILLHKLEQDHVYAKRISLDCVTFDTEETTRTYFQVALREKHNKKCGGDPDITPVIDRYRVNRASGKLDWYDPVNDNWQPYDPARIK